MIRFWTKQIVHVGFVVWLVSTLTFVLLRLAPGDPAYILLTANDVPASERALQTLREELGLTDSPLIQYANWMRDVFSSNWGTSYVSGESVLTELLQRLPATIELAVAGLLVMLFVTLVIGITTAMYSTGWLDRSGRLLALLGAAIPSFWLGFLLIYMFSVRGGWLPSIGHGTWKHLVLPALTLGLGMGAVYAHVLRTNMREVLNQNFIKASKARGLSTTRIMLFQVFQHAALPIVTMVGTSFAYMVGGSMIVESIFSWPGVGKYIMVAIQHRDYPVIQGYVVLVSALFVVIHAMVDFIGMLLDPRLRVR